jgi:predicted  nucleic acid-binding Zn-ribbon protein
MAEKTANEYGLERDAKIVDKIRADQAHKALKQEHISVQYEIARLKVSLKEAEGRSILDRTNIDLKLEINKLQKAIAVLRVHQKELEGKLNQSRFNIKKLTDEIELLKGRFFSAKDSGL